MISAISQQLVSISLSLGSGYSNIINLFEIISGNNLLLFVWITFMQAIKKKLGLYIAIYLKPGIRILEHISEDSKTIETLCKIESSAKLNSSAINIFPSSNSLYNGPLTDLGIPCFSVKVPYKSLT